MDSQKIIQELLKELQANGVRWLNDKDLGSTSKGSNHACMFVDFSETRLEIINKEGYFEMIFGREKSTLNRLMKNPILAPFIGVKDSIYICFSLTHKKVGQFGHSQIGKNQKSFFNEITNYTFEEGNSAYYSSSKNGDCGGVQSDKPENVKLIKDILSYMNIQFKDNDFYKDWEYSKDKVAISLNKIKNI